MDQTEPATIQRLIAGFNQSGDHQQEQIVRSLAEYGEQAVPLLVDALESSSLAHVRSWSCVALARILGESAWPYVLQGLRDPQMSVRLRAMQCVVTLGHSQSATYILPLLHDPSGGVRVNTLHALIMLKVSDVTEELVRPLTNDCKWYVRQHAARAIGELGIMAAMPHLARLADDQHPAVRKAAVAALSKLRLAAASSEGPRSGTNTPPSAADGH